MMIKIGVLQAGGKGTRAYPKTSVISKVMLEIEGKTILERNIGIMRDKLKITEIYVVTGHFGDMIKNYFGDGSKFGVHINYIHDRELKGLAWATYLLKDYIYEPFVMILGDEIYVDSNHEEIQNMKNKDFIAMIGVNKTESINLIKKNYSVEIKNSRIMQLIEKPERIKNNLLGCGTYILTPAFLEFIPKTPKSQKTGRIELTQALDQAAKETKKVYPFFLNGEYINVNTVEDLNIANYTLRNKNFSKYKISVIIPTKNEEKTIGNVINDFKEINGLKEILVIDNSEDNTTKIAKEAGGNKVKVIKKNLRYGGALKYGMDIAKGYILLLTEADSTFKAKDVPKILEYMKDADMVIGTRTTRQMIEQGANMNWFLRWGNVFMGKFIELLWWREEPRFTDVGCTFRAIWKESFNKIKNNLHGEGPEFSPEMMIEALKSKLRIIEIPLSYYKRSAGESKHSEGFKKIKTGIKMLKLILKKRFLSC